MADKRFTMSASPAPQDETGVLVFFSDNSENGAEKLSSGSGIAFYSLESFEAFKTAMKRGGLEIVLR